MINIGGNIKRIRVGLGLTQLQFAKLVGLNKQTIWFYENDRRNIIAIHLWEMSKKLDIDINEFFR